MPALSGKAAHGLHDPGLIRVAGWLMIVHAHAHLGHRLAHQERDDGPAKTHDEGKAQQSAQVQAVGRQVAVHPQQAGGDAQHHHHGDIGQQKKCNAFHTKVLRVK